MLKTNRLCLLILFIYILPGPVSAKAIRCQKEAEAIGISETIKKANMPKELISLANPTELDDDDVVVYIGAHANYNYFKLKMNQKCKLIKIVDVEYAK